MLPPAAVLAAVLASSLAAVLASSLAACGDGDDVPAACHFASGRPCPPGQLCLGPQGGECNYYGCTEGGNVGTAVGCQVGPVAPVAGGPFNCDPATVTIAASGSFTPPPGPCPLGALYALDPDLGIPFVACVPVAQCRPIACDPAFDGDGCPSAHACDATSRTCVAR